ncbi:unnamed protein product [Paramecium primaurelia]|uniref:WD40-repeat-containing domain n=1 Tax=Paramecium primaurelia TaxID=5886 RepID=A0A8S1Q666_PARPR|nr:unnamed protein product [Paramecium primaurelia]
MNKQLIVGQYENKVEECVQGFQQYLDLSFNRIDTFLDQIAFDPQPQSSIPNKNINNIPKFDQIQFPSILQFTTQLIQEVQSIVKLTINKSFQLNQQSNTKHINQHNHNQLNFKPFTYNLIQNHSIQQTEYCRAIAINQDNSIVLAACKNQIKVFEFKQEQLKQIQILTEHQNRVTTLNLMKKSTQFISGSKDKQIIIWSMDQNNQWICSQKLNEHNSEVNCLLLNNNEDLIVSGSDDKTIKFWRKQNQWKCSQTITDHTNYVVGLSLNEKQNRVISCGYDMFILVIEESLQDQKWNVIQKITVEEYGYRICFINDNVFTFQPRLKDQMYYYEINNTNQQYTKTKEIVVKSDHNGCDYYFPQQYIKSKCLLVNKNGQNVNLIRKNQNADFITQQSIQFGHNGIYGQISEDGQYLMTWDYNSKEIQIRKYNEE